MQLKARTRESRNIQMVFKIIRQGRKIGFGMILTDGFSGRFPNMLLRVECKGGRPEKEHLQAHMLFK